MKKDSKDRRLLIGGSAGLVIVGAVVWLLIGPSKPATVTSGNIRPIAAVSDEPGGAPEAIADQEESGSARLEGDASAPGSDPAGENDDLTPPRDRKRPARRKPPTASSEQEPETETSQPKKKSYGK